MSREALLGLMRDRLGLDPETLGERVLDDACAEARRSFGVDNDRELYQRVAFDLDAFAECTERFVVPESWFFRASEQFDDLVRFARELHQQERRPLRVLSLPCAAGEEAHSAVMALLDAGFPPADIDVLGIDVSQLAVQRAQAGSYRRNSLRGQALSPAWMQETDDGFLIDPAVRRCTRFRVGNALDPQLLRTEDRFDVIFCRNLLIYLHPDARARLLATLLAALNSPGLVLAGQAEVLTTFTNELQPFEGGCPLSFVRREKNTVVGLPDYPVAVARTLAPKSPAAYLQPFAMKAAMPVIMPVIESPEPDTMAAARRLADAGQTDQARAVCLAQLARNPADVPALFLMGLLESAQGNTEAADRAFVRVLYLDRQHLDAMEQRIGLAERQGQAELARDLRARVVRMRQRKESAP